MELESSLAELKREIKKLKEENRLLRDSLEQENTFSNDSNFEIRGSSEERIPEDKYSKAFNNTLVMNTITDIISGVYIEVNDTFCKTLGFRKAELIGKSSSELQVIPFDSRKKILSENDINKGIRNVEITLRKKSGQELAALFSAELINVHGQQYMYSTVLDITESKKIQADLLASERKFRAIFDIIGVGIALTDEAGKIIDCNAAYEKILGRTKNALIGRKFGEKRMKVVRPDLSPMPIEEFASVRALIEKREVRDTQKGIYQSDKTIAWLSVNAEPVNLPGYGVIVSYTDITTRIEAEKALKEKDELYRTVVENITDVIWVLNLNQNRFTYISPSVYQLRGFTAEEAMAQTMQESLSPESVDLVFRKVYPKLEQFLANPNIKDHLYNELQQTRKGGGYVWIETITQFQFAKNGDVEVMGVTRNIEQRKKTELALRDSEARLKLSIDAANEGTWDWNVTTDEVQFNAKWAEMLGYEPEELKQHINTWRSHIHPEDSSRVEDALKKHIDGESDSYKVEYRLHTKSGDWKWVEDVGKVIERDEYQNPTRVIGLHYDLSQQKNIQQQLLEVNATKDKFFSIVAHDLRNPFSAILGFSGLIDEECKNSNFDNIQEYNTYILQSARSGYNLLVNLLDWSRIQNGKIKFNPNSFNLYQSVKSLFVSFNASINEKKQEFQILFPADFTIYADRLMIETILRNLISNAIKFTPQGGIISLSAAKTKGETRIAISDTGVGISPDKVARLFKIEESFSTAGTKNEVGTGLGLVLCKDFIKQHKGTLSVASELNKGTTFTILIPSDDGDVIQQDNQ